MSFQYSNYGIGLLSAYKNFEQIGEGSYGYVYRATNRITNHLVALKKLIIAKDTNGVSNNC